ncbi:CLUMA_CG013249, isoform A [Clunio marinus]|uniref:CLUMA_CG013249, isoform A n=1 Tax=Clunio marinus TaxID=568069 RepID=A0A1J1IIC4_9DIPT|nr:CLUMA_CG013249, isoform A [Clunio marinus]
MILAEKIVSLALLISLTYGESENKKTTKRGIDDYGYPIGYNGWASSLKTNPLTSASNLERSNVFVPSAHDLSLLVAAAKKAAFDVRLAQEYVNAAKEEVLFLQKLVREKETLAQIASQKSEAAQHALRNEAQNAVLAQQKLAKAKAFAAEQQLKQALKDAEAAKAIQSSANNANTEIQKAEQAAKLSFFKQNIGPHKPFPNYLNLPTFPSSWRGIAYPLKPIFTPLTNSY